MDGFSERGTLFVTPEGAGILASLDHGECRVLLNGTISGGSCYSDVTGFRHWHIEVDGPGDEPQMLFTYGHPGLTSRG